MLYTSYSFLKNFPNKEETVSILQLNQPRLSGESELSKASPGGLAGIWTQVLLASEILTEKKKKERKW